MTGLTQLLLDLQDHPERFHDWDVAGIAAHYRVREQDVRGYLAQAAIPVRERAA